MAPLRHFITGDFEKRTVFLPDKEYGLALDALVKGCADVLITSGAGPSLRILLGKRRVEPQPDWWFVGGRTRPGDTPAEGAARNVKRELGSTRPLRGRRDLQLRLAPPRAGARDERHRGRLHGLRAPPRRRRGGGPVAGADAEEYADAAWAPDAVLAGDYHPALQQAVRDLLARRAYGALRDAAADASAGAGAARRRGACAPGASPRRRTVQGPLRGRRVRLRGPGDGRRRAAAGDGRRLLGALEAPRRGRRRPRWGLAVLGLAAFVAGRYSARG
ncbi:hypothetical protein JL720_12259 [Aureococcus anophagefferens]|nr:hypothetical protein JL720_12259 [Aureococcus anophagefferens]